jgi:predicted DNA-binding transcriptional regulator YafY
MMPSATYRLIRAAIENERQITCRYGDHDRALCPHIVGWTGGEEKLLAWQFGRTTSSVLPPGGEWRCLRIAEMQDVAARDGRWHTGSRHRSAQSCVQEIDLDINVHVRTGAR